MIPTTPHNSSGDGASAATATSASATGSAGAGGVVISSQYHRGIVECGD